MLDLDQPETHDAEPYPTSDGRPMGETDFHRQQIIDLLVALEAHYRHRQDVYVSGDILMFYEPGNRRRHLCPDVLVCLGVPKKKRSYYKIWEEGKAPDLVFEVTSTSTRLEDLGEKKGLYAILGIKELCLFDPRDEYLKPRLRLYRLQGEEYISVIPPRHLETVNLNLEVVDNALRLSDPVSGERLQNIEEMRRNLELEKERTESLAKRLRELGEEV